MPLEFFAWNSPSTVKVILVKITFIIIIIRIITVIVKTIIIIVII